MYYSRVKYCDIANGPGVRTSLFVSGCTRHCKGCFNPETWPFNSGKPFTAIVEKQILDSLLSDYIAGLSLLGGEPFEPENQATLLELVKRVRARFPAKTIWAFSGFTWGELTGVDAVRPPCHTSPHLSITDRLIACLDVVVDGPFELDKTDITLRFRGSSNQRLIDVQQTLAAQGNKAQGQKTDTVILWHDDPLFSRNSL